MKVELREHFIKQDSRVGIVERSLNQYLVFAEHSETKKMVHVGILGMHEGAKFLPTLHDLDKQTCQEIADACGEELEKQIETASAPVSPQRDAETGALELDIDD